MINLKTAVFAGIVAITSLPAFAATVTTDKIQPTYTGLLAAPTSNSSGFRLNFQGSEFANPAPNSRTPWEDFAAIADTAYYNSIEAGGFAEYDFGTTQTSFSLMWGSPDSYNTLSFFDGNTEVFSIAGNDTAITSTPGFQNGLSFVNVSITDLAFTKVVFESGSDAFEFSNVAPVPLPAAAWTLGAAIGALSLTARKRRAAKA